MLNLSLFCVLGVFDACLFFVVGLVWFVASFDVFADGCVGFCLIYCILGFVVFVMCCFGFVFRCLICCSCLFAFVGFYLFYFVLGVVMFELICFAALVFCSVVCFVFVACCAVLRFLVLGIVVFSSVRLLAFWVLLVFACSFACFVAFVLLFIV